MRVYEFAKEQGLQAKELLQLLKENGFSLASHMSVLPDDALKFLEKKFKKEVAVAPSAPKKIEPEVAAQPSKPAVVQPPKKEESQKEKKVHIPSTTSANKPTYQEKTFQPKEEPKKELEISLTPMTLSEAAEKMQRSTSDLILTLLKWGILSNKNQLLPIDLISRLAEQYQVKVVRPVEKAKEEEQKKAAVVAGQELKERVPVVVVMGHVDHGKTSLLDFIRKTRVAAKEKGGITQHLGAYEAQTSQGNVVFIDTPGHEAFSKIRIRGTRVADVVVLVVAADDGIMPQTIEALKHAQSMKVLIVVAINKIDKVDKSRIDVVKRELATQFHLLPEEWGGDTLFVPISAKTGAGIDTLLEMIVLQAQMMELKADVHGSALGFVLESKLEKGRGPVATLLTHQGVLKVGDYFVSGNTTGKVSSIIDSHGARITEVMPSQPALVAGFSELPNAGDNFEVVSKEVYLKAKQSAEEQKRPSATRRLGTENAITLLIKTDSNSSKEALVESIEKLSKKSEKGFLILQSGIGSVSESDIMLAADTHSRIVTLHVKVEPNAISLAQRLGVSISSFDIIYKLLEHLQDTVDSMKTVKMVKTKIGEASVRKVFDIKNLGVIAGAYVKEGIFSREGTVVVYRGSKKVGEGKITSLQRDKNMVKEVHTGFECAFMVDNFKEWQIDDRVECFLERPAAAPATPKK